MERLLGMSDPNSKGGRRGGHSAGGHGGFTASQVAVAGVAAGFVIYLLSGGFARVAVAVSGGGNGGDQALLAASVDNLAAQVNKLVEEQRRGFADIRAQLQSQSMGGGGTSPGETLLGGKTAAAAAASALASGGGHKRKPGIHVVVTSNGNRYMNWQTRVLYANFKKVAAAQSAQSLDDGAEGAQLRGFTRVLHRTSDDELMKEVPTQRFYPLQPDCDVWCQYPVADRSKALLEWLDTPDSKRYEHVMIIETDYVFIAQPKLAPPLLPAPGHALSFPFGYIVPTWPARLNIIKRYYPGGKPSDIPQTGNAPVLMRFADFAKVCPKWVALTAQLEKDGEAKEAFGWVREMYAYSIAAALAGVKHATPGPPISPLMVQPPADDNAGKACIAHYTWGAIFHEDNSDGKVVWRWDKREYAAGQYGDKCARLEKIKPMPPWRENLVLQDNVPVSRGKYDLLALLVEKFNEAVEDVNSVNGGVPAGLSSWEEADALSQPSQESVKARAEVERRERDEGKKQQQQ